MMKEPSTNDEVISGIGPLGNPLAGWPNDDLLLSEAGQRRLKVLAPDFEAILHWPQLLTVFRKHDRLANNARSRNLRNGLAAIGISATGLLVEALTHMFVVPAVMVHLGAAALMATGFIMGLWHLLDASKKSEWLLNRFWTERLRQFYFQFLLSHTQLAAQALTGEAQRELFMRARKGALAKVLDDTLKDVTYMVDMLLEDEAEVSPWLDPAWGDLPVFDTHDSEVDSLLEVIARQRIAIQIEYTRKKLRHGWHSPKTRALLIKAISDTLAVTVLLLNMSAAILLFLGHEEHDIALRVLMTINAVSATLIIFFRVLSDGCRFDADTERYEWYLASLEVVDRRFRDATSLTIKAAALFDLERAAYQEMRRFVVAHRGSRFLL